MRTMPCKRVKLLRQRGIASVEFALISVLLCTLLMAGSEFGRAMFQYNTLAKSARAAARHLSQFPPGDSAAIAQARLLAVYASTTDTGTAVVPGLTTAMVAVCDASNCDANKRQSTGQTRVNLVTVTVSGVRFVPVASWVLPAFTFDSVSVTMPQGLA